MFTIAIIGRRHSNKPRAWSRIRCRASASSAHATGLTRDASLACALTRDYKVFVRAHDNTSRTFEKLIINLIGSSHVLVMNNEEDGHKPVVNVRYDAIVNSSRNLEFQEPIAKPCDQITKYFLQRTIIGKRQKGHFVYTCLHIAFKFGLCVG